MSKNVTTDSPANKKPSDGLILVMGQAGCGKTTFIRSAAGEAQVKGSMEANTTVRWVQCSHPESKKLFTLIETPGFDNTDPGKSDSAILVDTAKWLKEHFHGVKFGGILYLQQQGTAQPMLTELLSNDLIKPNLIHVVTVHKQPSGGGDTSKQGDAEFPDITEVPTAERKTQAWKIIDQVWHKVEPHKLTVGGFQRTLRKAGGGGNWFLNFFG